MPCDQETNNEIGSQDVSLQEQPQRKDRFRSVIGLHDQEQETTDDPEQDKTEDERVENGKFLARKIEYEEKGDNRRCEKDGAEEVDTTEL